MKNNWKFDSPEFKLQKTAKVAKVFFLFLMGCMLSFSANAHSLNKRFTISMQDVAIKEVLNRIELESDVSFFYQDEISVRKTLVTVDFENSTLTEILDQLFTGTSLTYQLLDKYVAIIDKEKTTNQQENHTVKGRVVDESGESIPGASIVVKGTITGTITDMEGNFTLPGVPEDGTLVFSFVGMTTLEEEVAGKTFFNIVLQEDVTNLNEVVIVGYGVQKKVNMTGSISTVKTKELSSIATPNLSNTLAGRAPGVGITGNSGFIGASSEIRIRGAQGDPLYVIDGIVRDKNAFDALEANEVSELSFLKDAATASIYGSQAGNGVLLITTKKGDKTSKPVFNYQGSYTFMNPTHELMSDQFNATDELIYQNRVAEYQGLEQPNGDTEFAYFANRNYNVNDYIWQNPWNTKNSVSVSGGSDKVTYYALVSHIGEEGSYKNLNNEKFNLRSNVTAEITKAITMNLNISGNVQNQKRFYWPFSGDDEQTVGDLYRCTFNWPRTYPFYLNDDGTPAENGEITDYPVQTPIGSWQAWNVIDQVIGDRYIKTRKREVDAILSFDIDLSFITEGLTTKVVGNYIGNDYSRKKYFTFQHNYCWNSADPDGNRFIPAAPDPNDMNTFAFYQDEESISYNINSLWSEQFNWFLNYKTSFGDHDINATVVWEQAKNGGEFSYAKAEDPLTDYDQTFVYSTDTEKRWGDTYEATGGRLSWIGRFNYSYLSRYIFEFSCRYDGNSLFPEDERWGFFPSFSGAWRISDEPFMEKTSNWLNSLKLRASYGTTGNDLNVYNNAITPFSYLPTFQSGNSYIFGSSLNLGIQPGDTPNTQLTWATTYNYNAGFDFSVLDSHLNGNFDVFYKKEEDILGSRLVTIPDTYGQDLAPENYAERSWKGLELNLGWRDNFGELNYTVYANLGYVENQWDKLDQSALYEEGGNLHDLTAIGSSMDRYTGYNTVKMIRTQEDLEALPDDFTHFGRTPYLGSLLFEDVRGDGYSEGADGKIDENDIQLLSDKASPRIDYGFGVGLNWKNLSLDIHFQGVGDYDHMVCNLGGIGGIRQYGGSSRPYYPIWTKDVYTPDNTDAKYPRPVGHSWAESGTGNQSFWIKNGAYLRLKNVNFGYNLPTDLISKIGLMNAQLFVNATNLFVISDMTEFQDPEQSDYDSYPLMKSFTFGVDIKF